MIAYTNATIATPAQSFTPGALIFSDAAIHAVGHSDDLQSEIRNCEQVVDLEGRCILPGFVDAHTHLIFGGSRVQEFEMRAKGASYEDIARAGGGIWSTVRATRGLSEDELVQIGKKHASWMLANGTTTAEAKSGYGLDTETELRLLRAVRRVGEDSPLRTIPTFLGLHAVPPEFNSRGAFVQHVLHDQLPLVAREAQYVDAFIEEGYFTPDDARRLAGAAKKFGLGLRLHVDQLSLGGGAQLAAELGAITADHLEFTDADGVDALAISGVIPVLLPGSVYALGKRNYPRRMLDAGLPVVLASDFNPGSSPTPSLPFVMNLACTQMGMTPSEALQGVTINAARSLGLDSEIGSLEVGKVADFTVWNVADPREIAYWIGAPLLHSVHVSGKRAF